MSQTSSNTIAAAADQDKTYSDLLGYRATVPTSTPEPSHGHIIDWQELPKLYSTFSATMQLCVNLSSRVTGQLTCRAILEPSVHFSLVTAKLIRQLGGQHLPLYTSITDAAGNHIINGLGHVHLSLQPRNSFNPAIRNSCIVVQQIAKDIPIASAENYFRTEIKSDKLADSEFWLPANVDMLLGADICSKINIVQSEYFEKCIANGKLTAQNTTFGWTVWGIDTLPSQSPARASLGKYVVAASLQRHAHAACNCRDIALESFTLLERRLNYDPKIREEARTLIQEFLISDYIVPASTNAGAPDMDRCCYIPYTIISKGIPRILFGTSCLSSSHPLSNNGEQNIDKQLSNYPQILARFRTYKYAISVTIHDMYQQIGRSKAEWNLQRVFWRPNIEEPIREYCVTGLKPDTSSTAFYATQALHRCAMDSKEHYPIASQAGSRDFWVDTILSGCDTLKERANMQQQLLAMLEEANFQKIQTNINVELAQQECISADIIKSSSSLLGLKWSSDVDHIGI